MSSFNPQAPRRSAAPRRVRNGLKLSSPGTAPKGWVARRWLEIMQKLFAAPALEEGLEYARIGQIISLEIAPGRVVAQVQGRAGRPYATTLNVPVFSAQQWDRLIATMAGEAIYAAKLLAGELPETIGVLCAALGSELLPGGPGAILASCTCGFPGVCKHAAAVGYLLAERLDEDALEIFALHGLPAPMLLERLRQARAILTSGVAAAHGEAIPADRLAPSAPLTDCIDDYWRAGPELEQLAHSPPPQHVSHALLRRLGPSPLGGKFPLVGLLASIYDVVAAAAVRLRDQAEGVDEDAMVPGLQERNDRE
jgi:uncharacterized Zn finger protein